MGNGCSNKKLLACKARWMRTKAPRPLSRRGAFLHIPVAMQLLFEEQPLAAHSPREEKALKKQA